MSVGCLPASWFAAGMPRARKLAVTYQAAVGEMFFRGWKIGLDDLIVKGHFDQWFSESSFHRGKIQKRVLVLFKFGTFTERCYSVFSFTSF